MNIFIVNVNVVLSYNLIFIYLLSAGIKRKKNEPGIIKEESLKLSINIIQFSQLYQLKHFYVKNLQILATIFNFYVSNFNRTFASSFQGYRKDKSLVFCILWSLNQHKTRQPLNVYTLRLLKGGVVMLYCPLYTRMEILEYNLQYLTFLYLIQKFPPWINNFDQSLRKYTLQGNDCT